MAKKKPLKAKSAPRKKTRAMPKWKKSPPELVALFTTALAAFPEAEMRKMFGYPCAFVNGNMTNGLFADSMMMRLDADDRTAMLKIPGAAPFEPVPGRIMREYVFVPSSVLGNAKQLNAWLAKSIAYTSGLPPKKKR